METLMAPVTRSGRPRAARTACRMRSRETAVSVGSSLRYSTWEVGERESAAPSGRPRTTNWPDWLRTVTAPAAPAAPPRKGNEPAHTTPRLTAQTQRQAFSRDPTGLDTHGLS